MAASARSYLGAVDSSATVNNDRAAAIHGL